MPQWLQDRDVCRIFKELYPEGVPSIAEYVQTIGHTLPRHFPTWHVRLIDGLVEKHMLRKHTDFSLQGGYYTSRPIVYATHYMWVPFHNYWHALSFSRALKAEFARINGQTSMV